MKENILILSLFIWLDRKREDFFYFNLCITTKMIIFLYN